jgi:hypothetical protein
LVQNSIKAFPFLSQLEEGVNPPQKMGTGPIFCCYVHKLKVSSFLQKWGLSPFFSPHFSRVEDFDLIRQGVGKLSGSIGLERNG